MIKKMILGVALTTSVSVVAKEAIICKSNTSDEMMLYIDAGKLKGKTVSCIYGELWAVDGNTCSANGYYAIHGNSLVLSSFVKRWQDAVEFDTLTYYGKNDTSILFTASGMLAGGDGVEFSLNRHTGRAVFKDHVQGTQVVFSCSKSVRTKI
jgi:hypothetical protein